MSQEVFMKNRYLIEFKQAELLFKQGRLEEAEKKLIELHVRCPHDKSIAGLLADILIKTDRIFDVEEELLYSLIKNDTITRLHFARRLILLGDKKEAERHINIVLKSKDKDLALLELGALKTSQKDYQLAKKYLEKIVDTQGFNNDINLQNLYIAIREKNYEEALKYTQKITPSKEISSNRLDDIEYFLKMKIGIIKKKNNFYEKGYFLNQLENYHEGWALEHIKLHLDVNEKKKKHNVFDENIEVNDLYRKTKTHIRNINPNMVTLVDKYVIKHEIPIGNCSLKNTYGLMVITPPNSKNILTMYPYPDIPKKGKSYCKFI